MNQAVERRADLALARASENHGAGEKAVENEGTLTDDDTTAGDDSIAGSGTTADDNTGANDDTLDGVVPSETALDAAVPSERQRENGTGAASTSAVDPGEADGDRADDSWRAGALDRLRDSL